MPESKEVIDWTEVKVVEATVGGARYRIEEPPGCDGQVNVYRNGEFVGPAPDMSFAKDAIRMGLT